MVPRMLAVAVAVATAAVICSAARLAVSDEDPFALPDTLKIGAGVSAIQTEGAWDADGKIESASDHVLHLGKLTSLGFLDPHQHDVAADSYHRYKEDVAMAKQLGLQIYRFSIAWGRVFYEGKPIDAGIKYYHDFIKEIKDNGMQPLVTLYHFDHPWQYEADFKGWQSDKMVDKFVEYAKFAFQEFGSEVDLWVTMNEPNMYCPYFSTMYVVSELYTEKEANIYDCMRNLVLAHAKSYRAFKENKYTGRVGINAIIMHATANTTQPEDVYAAELYNEVHAGQVLNPVVHGDFPQVLKDALKDKIKEFTDDEKQLIRGTTDFIGFNVYFSMVAAYKFPGSGSNSVIPIMGKLIEDLPMVYATVDATIDKTNPMAIFSQVAPESLRDALLWAWERYQLPLVITENGLGDTVGLGKRDHQRASYHSAYLRMLVKTIKEFNVDVFGYCAWSLIDSFEWSAGYGRPFGLVHVDYENKSLNRSLKDSSEFWIEMSKTRVVPLVEEPTTPAPATPAPASAAVSSTCFLLQVSSALICILRFLK